MSIKFLKKAAAMLALCMMLGALSGCNNDSEASGETGETSASTVESTAEVEDPMKVGYIFNDDIDNSGTSAEINAQRLKALKHCNIESVYIDEVNITDFPEAVKLLGEAGCTHIVTASPVYINAINGIAEKYMNINFIGFGCRIPTINISAYTEHPYEGVYVAGMAAAFNSDAEKIGIVVDTSLLYPTATINAAALGSQLVNKDALTFPALAATESEIHDAVDYLKAQGCDVIISYTESPETTAYCEALEIKHIGNLNYNESKADYDNMLMYFYGSRDSYFLSQFKQIQLDTWKTDSYVGSMANGMIAVSEALPAAKDGTQDIISSLATKIKSGACPIFVGQIKNNAGNVTLMADHVMTVEEIYNMTWLVEGVQDVETFVVPITELEPNDFEIKQ